MCLAVASARYIVLSFSLAISSRDFAKVRADATLVIISELDVVFADKADRQPFNMFIA
jgi:hypothetical protein